MLDPAPAQSAVAWRLTESDARVDANTSARSQNATSAAADDENMLMPLPRKERLPTVRRQENPMATFDIDEDMPTRMERLPTARRQPSKPSLGANSDDDMYRTEILDAVRERLPTVRRQPAKPSLSANNSDDDTYQTEIIDAPRERLPTVRRPDTARTRAGSRHDSGSDLPGRAGADANDDELGDTGEGDIQDASYDELA